ncbi:MAG: DNA-3-methyladenine glycosylase [bacterium]|nr:DNA-3-methyladenine glycosylase [bacterium]
MARKIVSSKFFDRPTLDVAKELLGTFLVRKKGDMIISSMITDVEAYVGPTDRASHASRGRTLRTEVMFGKPGCWYIYLIYGMYYCLNIVTEKQDYPAAILIRGVEGISGPGRVSRHFKIHTSLNALPANHKTGLWIEDRGIKIHPHHIKHGTRIGVDYAGRRWKDKKWRFYLD